MCIDHGVERCIFNIGAANIDCPNSIDQLNPKHSKPWKGWTKDNQMNGKLDIIQSIKQCSQMLTPSSDSNWRRADQTGKTIKGPQHKLLPRYASRWSVPCQTPGMLLHGLRMVGNLTSLHKFGPHCPQSNHSSCSHNCNYGNGLRNLFEDVPNPRYEGSVV